jgi:hypothetical protein
VVFEPTDAAIQFGGVGYDNIIQRLGGIDQALERIERRLSQNEAETTNMRIIIRNHQYSSDPLRPLHKYVSCPLSSAFEPIMILLFTECWGWACPCTGCVQPAATARCGPRLPPECTYRSTFCAMGSRNRRPDAC